jgi:hypothetical protein
MVDLQASLLRPTIITVSVEVLSVSTQTLRGFLHGQSSIITSQTPGRNIPNALASEV